jgi:hypothetical protein
VIRHMAITPQIYALLAKNHILYLIRFETSPPHKLNSRFKFVQRNNEIKWPDRLYVRYLMMLYNC